MMDSSPKSTVALFIAIYLSLLVDNILLTVVVPIIPEYLFSDQVDENHLKVTLNSNPINLVEHLPSLEEDNGPLGTLLASKSFIQLILTPLIGHLTGTVQLTALLKHGSYIMLLAAILYAYGRSYALLVAARALHGCASATISVAGICLLAEMIPKESRSKFMPVACGGIALGVLIGYPLGGITYEAFGKTTPFLIISLIIICNIALQLVFVKETDWVKVLNKPIAMADWTELWRDIPTLISTGAICICTSAMAVLESCLPLWLMGRFEPPPSKWQIGMAFLPDSIGYFIGSHFTGLIASKSWSLALSGMVIVGISSCSLPLARSIPHLAIPHFGLGLGVGIVDAILVPMLANFVDQKESTHYGPMYSLQQTSVNLAYLLGPLLGGRAVRTIGFPWLIRFVGLLNIAYCSLLVELE